MNCPIFAPDDLWFMRRPLRCGECWTEWAAPPVPDRSAWNGATASQTLLWSAARPAAAPQGWRSPLTGPHLHPRTKGNGWNHTGAYRVSNIWTTQMIKRTKFHLFFILQSSDWSVRHRVSQWDVPPWPHISIFTRTVLFGKMNSFFMFQLYDCWSGWKPFPDQGSILRPHGAHVEGYLSELASDLQCEEWELQGSLTGWHSPAVLWQIWTLQWRKTLA